MLLCEMAGYYKNLGKTLIDRLGEIYAAYGYYIDALDEFVRPGKTGMDEIRSTMSKARSVMPNEASGILKVTDYLPGGILPSSNVIQYDIAGGGRIMLRPSGTEPKLKIYYAARGDTEAEAADALEGLKAIVADIGIE
jgi:phosphoglucomutase